MNIQEKNGKILSLQALRGLGFLGIFLSHVKSDVSWSTLGVSIFFILSGFLLQSKYEDKNLECGIKNNFYFSFDRIKKLYPLHIVTMIIVDFLIIVKILIDGITKKDIIITLFENIVNIFLVQTWIPHSTINTSINGVAWYLSVTMFLYFVFPNISKFIKKISTSKAFIITSVILLLEVISCIPALYFLGSDSNVYIWFMYCFPIFRIGDFFAGCCLAKFHRNNKIKNKSVLYWSIVEVITLFAYIITKRYMSFKTDNLILTAFQNLTTVYVVFGTLIVYCFVVNKGIVSKALSNKVIINLGNISSNAFLIHFVIVIYTRSIISYFEIDYTGIIKYVLIVAQLAVTILMSVLWSNIEKKIKRR